MRRDEKLLLKVHTASQLVGAIVGLQLELVGVQPYLFALLTHIRALAPVSPSRISAASGIPLTTLRDNIQRLVDRGLVKRKPNPADGRSYLVVLTTRGEVLFRAADPAVRTAYLTLERELDRPLADYEQTVDELIAALRETLRKLEERAAPVSPAGAASRR